VLLPLSVLPKDAMKQYTHSGGVQNDVGGAYARNEIV
jgi:hypothetical protein